MLETIAFQSLPSESNPGINRERVRKYGKTPVWVVMVHGAFHTKDSFDQMKQPLQDAGLNYLAVDLPARVPWKNFDDYADSVVKQMRAHEIERAVLLASSRGGDTAARVPERARGIEVEELIFLASALHGASVFSFSEKEKKKGHDIERNPQVYLDSIRELPLSMARFDRDRAPEVFYNRCPAELRPHYSAKLQTQRHSRSEPALLRWPFEIPVTCAHGTYDNVVTLDWARHRAEMLRTELIEWTADHSPHISIPETVTELVASRIARVY